MIVDSEELPTLRLHPQPPTRAPESPSWGDRLRFAVRGGDAVSGRDHAEILGKGEATQSSGMGLHCTGLRKGCTSRPCLTQCHYASCTFLQVIHEAAWEVSSSYGNIVVEGLEADDERRARELGIDPSFKIHM